VSLKKVLGKIFMCAVLELGLLAGAQMTPEEIEKLMNVMNRVKVVQIKKTESD
jgi:hypothetical protein